MGDLRSQIAACRLGGAAARRALRQVRPRDDAAPRSSRIFDETERKCRASSTQIPDGVYEAESYVDATASTRASRSTIHVKVTVAGSDMTIDLSGCSPRAQAAINSRTLAGAYIAYKALTRRSSR